MKLCTKCKQLKTLNDFYRRHAECKECFLKRCRLRNKEKEALRHAEYYRKHKNEIIEKVKNYTTKNKEKVIAKSKVYYCKNRELLKSKVKERYRSNPEEHRRRNKERIVRYKKRHPERRAEIAIKYYYLHKEEIFARQRKRWRDDDKYRLCNLMSCQVRSRLKRRNKEKGGQNWEKLVGYKADKLILHLRDTIPEGYVWQDFMSGKLHIDHKIPVAAFNFSSPEDIDFKRCFAIKNLQLLPGKENMEKRDKLTEPFQPSLSGI